MAQIGNTKAKDLVATVIDAHGGLDLWNKYTRIEVGAVTGGGLFPLKGLMPDRARRTMTIWLHEQRASVDPFGAPDQHTDFTPDHLSVVKRDGSIVAAWDFPRSTFIGHGLGTAWAPVHRAYFNGYAMWTYLTTPFHLQMPGVDVEEEEPWKENENETWRVIRASYPGAMATHSPIQRFYFGEDGLLRRHDYNVDVAGSFAAAQIVSKYIEADGIKLPSVRRAYAMGPDRRPITELLMVAIDLSSPQYR